ncbi:5-oxoprolinase [Verrucomicrobia bacterium LW23]|nr:5-oxoprolinase [Verrucomicrobia bacterium LW23]
MAEPWRICVDTGGTFTDCVAQSPEGEEVRAKVLSSGSLRGRVEKVAGPGEWAIAAPWTAVAPDDFVCGFAVRILGGDTDGAASILGEVERYSAVTATVYVKLNTPGDPNPRVVAGAGIELLSPDEAPVLAARLVTRTPARKPLPPMIMRLATTKGTNALLEEKGAKVAFFVTRGHADLLRIGNQQRPDLFALDIHKIAPLHHVVIEVPERMSADGTELQPLEMGSKQSAEMEALAKQALASGCTAAAVALMHSYRNPAHEEALCKWLSDNGFAHVSASAALAGRIKIIPRAETCVADAYLAPILQAYLSRVAAPMEASSHEQDVAAEQDVAGNAMAPASHRLHVMTSAGGLVSRRLFRPKDSLLSGPAGGLVGAAAVARRAGITRVIGFDMGGTSTDVARYDGAFDYAVTHTIGRARLVAPALKIESVAAGGGSICGYRNGRLFVGPESAGASPGPACYGAGGPLALTDVHLLLGRLDAARLGIPVDADAAWRRLDAVLAAMESGAPVTAKELEARRRYVLLGFLEIADEIMAGTIRKISVREGYEPAAYGIVAFGGAGGLHACRVAERLGIRRVLHPRDAGLLSAFGLRQSGIERFAERQILFPLNTIGDGLGTILEELAEQATRELLEEGVGRDRLCIRARWIEARLTGQDAAMMLELPNLSQASAVAITQSLVEELFAERYKMVFGYKPPPRPLEIVSARIAAAEMTTDLEAECFDAGEGSGADAVTITEATTSTTVIDRATVRPGLRIEGPALVQDGFSTLYVEAGWSAVVGSQGSLLVEVTEDRRSAPASLGTERPIELTRELFTQRFLRLVEETGLLLQRTALSTNVKERLDFSCALLDPAGELVANAPHIPVHLGALGVCVRRVQAVLPLGPGDVAVTNHPAHGGSHLPDVTLLGPVHAADGSLLGYLANRAHHAELGGCRPGSMPPDATVLEDEGVVIAPRLLVRGGEADWPGMEAVLNSGRWPTRALADNLADLHAQLAAHRRGAELLRAMADEHGADEVRRFMRLMSDDAAVRMADRLVRRVAELPGGPASVDPAWTARGRERLDDGTEICVAMSVFVASGDGKQVQSGARARLLLDFSGTSSTHPGNLNATEAIVRSVVMYVLRVWIAEAIPLNEGLMRPVDMVLPEGCFLNPRFPTEREGGRAPAVVGGNVETSQRLADTLIKALGIAACSQGTMNNVIFGNERCSYYETVCGGAGAGPGFAGADGVHTHMTNTAITDPEVLEHRFPVRLRHFGLRPQSGGAGTWCGGNGIVREIEFLESMSLSLLTQHRVESPFGAAGGEPGAKGRQLLLRAGAGTGEVLASVAGVEVGPGDRLVLETPGGGGWGDAAMVATR